VAATGKIMVGLIPLIRHAALLQTDFQIDGLTLWTLLKLFSNTNSDTF